MKKVTAATGNYIVYFQPLTNMSNIFIRNGIYPLMFIGRVYNTINFSQVIMTIGGSWFNWEKFHLSNPRLKIKAFKEMPEKTLN